MNKLYIFGDSYSTPHVYVDPRDSWWGLLASDLSDKITQVDNYSWSANNFDSIAHIIVSNINMFEPNDYIVVGVPPVCRLTMFNPARNFNPSKVVYNNTLEEQSQEHVVCHTGLAQYAAHEMGQEYVSTYNESWAQAQVLRSILLLNNFIKSKCSNLVFLNLSMPFQPPTQWPTLASLQKQAQQPNMLLFDQTYYSVNLNVHKPADFDIWGWNGHQGAVGNAHWYNTAVRPLITNLGWV